MADSRQIAGLVGPSLVAITIPEAINAHVFVNQTAPVVYLNGALLFVAGLSIVRFHNRWTRSWPVMVTLVGWAAILAGLFRMFFPELGRQGAQSLVTVIASALITSAVGIFLTFKAYGPDDGKTTPGWYVDTQSRRRLRAEQVRRDSAVESTSRPGPPK